LAQAWDVRQRTAPEQPSSPPTAIGGIALSYNGEIRQADTSCLAVSTSGLTDIACRLSAGGARASPPNSSRGEKESRVVPRRARLLNTLISARRGQPLAGHSAWGSICPPQSHRPTVRTALPARGTSGCQSLETLPLCVDAAPPYLSQPAVQIWSPRRGGLGAHPSRWG
jgi:hypothetical protein